MRKNERKEDECGTCVMQTNWQSSTTVVITPAWNSLAIVGLMPNPWPRDRVYDLEEEEEEEEDREDEEEEQEEQEEEEEEAYLLGPSTLTAPLMMTDQLSNSSWSFITMVPAWGRRRWGGGEVGR